MSSITQDLQQDGFALRSGKAMQTWLGDSWSGWEAFAASWNDLPEDTHMADGGRYRRRRFAVFSLIGDKISRAPHQPHFQSRVHNRLNGGFGRWFEPVTDAIADAPLTLALIGGAAALFETVFPCGPTPATWHVEMHQFRIEVHAGQKGLPTPEGIHRDGVDGAFVVLVDRRNVSSGVTQIFSPDRHPLGAFTLADKGDAVFLDDTRVFHGVTAIAPLNSQYAAVRDVLVITFLRDGPSEPGR